MSNEDARLDFVFLRDGIDSAEAFARRAQTAYLGAIRHMRRKGRLGGWPYHRPYAQAAWDLRSYVRAPLEGVE